MGAGALSSLIFFKRRPGAIWLGTGIGLGMAIRDGQRLFSEELRVTQKLSQRVAHAIEQAPEKVKEGIDKVKK